MNNSNIGDEDIIPLTNPILRIAFIINQFNNPLKIDVPIIKNHDSNIYCNSKQKYTVHNE